MKNLSCKLCTSLGIFQITYIIWVNLCLIMILHLKLEFPQTFLLSFGLFCWTVCHCLEQWVLFRTDVINWLHFLILFVAIIAVPLMDINLSNQLPFLAVQTLLSLISGLLERPILRRVGLVQVMAKCWLSSNLTLRRVDVLLGLILKVEYGSRGNHNLRKVSAVTTKLTQIQLSSY